MFPIDLYILVKSEECDNVTTCCDDVQLLSLSMTLNLVSVSTDLTLKLAFYPAMLLR